MKIENENSIYNGAVDDKGQPSGQGKIEYKNGDTYEGQFLDGYRHGNGNYFFAADGGAIYEGEWKNGKRNGYGKLFDCETLLSYEGQWKNSVKHGKGKQGIRVLTDVEGTWVEGKLVGSGTINCQLGIFKGEFIDEYRLAVGKIYEYKTNKVIFEGTLENGLKLKGTYIDLHDSVIKGNFKDDKPNGVCKTVYKNGNIYEGEYVNGHISGKGKMTYTNGDVYEGEWLTHSYFYNEAKNGFGKMIYADGIVYEGNWKDNVPNGGGKKFYNNGDIYDGNWNDGKRSGQGTYTWKNGNFYQGNWENNDMTGYGKISNDNGIYEGFFKNDKKHGYGKIAYFDGKIYEGEWRDGMRQGKGKSTLSDGVIAEGNFDKDKANGEFHFTNPDKSTSVKLYSNGKVVETLTKKEDLSK